MGESREYEQRVGFCALGVEGVDGVALTRRLAEGSADFLLRKCSLRVIQDQVGPSLRFP